MSPPVSVFGRLSPPSTARLLAGILKLLEKEREWPMLMVIFWCAMAALTYWFAALE
jgi:hypothetical protein